MTSDEMSMMLSTGSLVVRDPYRGMAGASGMAVGTGI
jgi:hypothetical protein